MKNSVFSASYNRRNLKRANSPINFELQEDGYTCSLHTAEHLGYSPLAYYWPLLHCAVVFPK